jgi:hypothetical protein
MPMGAWIALAATLASGCAAAPMHVSALDDVERVRASAAAREGAQYAPELAARAERERAIAEQAHASGDNVEASLHAERAIAAYDHALAVARLARATTELASAEKARNDAVVEQQTLDATRASLEREADDVARQTEVIRARWLPAASAAAPERDEARRTAARAMVTEARLLCGAARLVSGSADGLNGADEEIAALAKRIDGAASGAAIDDSARARARCLDVLTRARRGAGHDDGTTDVLLTELSQANRWDPTRDERGVFVTLRDAYQNDALTEDAQAKLRELGRAAASHPSFGVQVVVHDATPSAGDSGDARRAKAAMAALVAGGAAPERVASELAGARLPIADPTDARERKRNERIEVVFVGP